MDHLRVTNITASFKVDRTFELVALCDDPLTYPSRVTVKNGKAKKFHSAVQRLVVNGKMVTALVYESGSVVLVGGQSQEIVTGAMIAFLEEHNCHLAAPLVFSNFVFTFSVKRRLNLRKLYHSILVHPLLSCPVYEVELFPSLLVSYKKVKASIFHTGRVIITGCRHPIQGQEMYTILISLFE